MKSTIIRLPILFFLLLTLFTKAQPNIGFQEIASGFTDPVDIANAGDDRLFIVEQAGFIRIIDANDSVLATPFLDINARVWTGGNEQGLLGLVFHPNYANNGYFYVNYTAETPRNTTIIARFSVSSGNPNVADPNSEMILMTQSQPFTNHNAGDLAFGPDGYLYFGLGDGGSGGDPNNNAQNPQEKLGKILRIDVDSGSPYAIPPSNPFVGNANVLDEIWALGVRNPWRFSFDRLTGDMWIADVGQNAWEEIDFQPANSTGGENYGWRCYEGNHTYNTSGCGAMSNYVFPVHEYSHSSSDCSVTGGFVYRGCQYPDLYGHYIFADYCSGKVWTIYDNNGSWATTYQGNFSNYDFATFGEGVDGELYYAGHGDGKVYHITEDSPASNPTIIANGDTTFCESDSVILTTQAGYASYIWERNNITVGNSQTITAKQAGLYKVTAIDTHGCAYTSNIQSISHLPAPTPMISAAGSTFCTGDSLMLATGNYNTYQWSDGTTTQNTYVDQSGTYSVTVTNNEGCSGSSQGYMVTEVSSLMPIISGDTAFCPMDSATITTGSYSTYSWSNGAATQSTMVGIAGNYTVTVSDANGCTGASSAFSISELILPTPSITPANAELCEGETITLSLDQQYNQYSWSTGGNTETIDIGQSGQYDVTVTNKQGCQGVSMPATVAVQPVPDPNISQQDSFLSTGSQWVSYQWFFEGDSLPGATMPSIVAMQEGNYMLLVTDSNGCSGSDTLTYSISGIYEQPIANVQIQPNPFTNQTTITFDLTQSSDISISLIDISGKVKILEENKFGQQGKHKLTIPGTIAFLKNPGVYLLKLQTNEQTHLFKLIKY